MRELIRRRLHGDESGVTLVIVALCLIALFGMLVLVVDVGGLLLNRREMVNASDAAALAAAKSCILPPSKDPRSPEQAADEFAFDNSSRAQTAAANITQISGCDTSATGYVSVQYSANQHLFFAPVLGAGTDRSVSTTATAIWGPAGAANPTADRDVPAIVQQLQVQRDRSDEDLLRLGRQQQRQRSAERIRIAGPAHRQPVSPTGGTRTRGPGAPTRATVRRTGSTTTPIPRSAT